MKNIFISYINFIYLLIVNININIKSKNSFYLLLKIINNGKNQYHFIDTTIKKTVFNITGDKNLIVSKGRIRSSNILINGNNNQLIINENSSINNLKITIRGNNCSICIGEMTTIGGGYLICMGTNNFIKIGKDCQMADDVSIWATDSHPIFDKNGLICNSSKPIKIEDHVWIGNKSIILKGVEIKSNSVIGMGSVVTKDVQVNSIYAGNPAKKIKDIAGWDRNFITI